MTTQGDSSVLRKSTHRLIGLNCSFDAAPFTTGFLFKRYKGLAKDMPVGKDRASTASLDDYVAIANHFFEDNIEVVRGYNSLFGRRFHELERENVQTALAFDHKDGDKPSRELSVDRGYRQVISRSVAIIVRNMMVLTALTAAIVAAGYVLICLLQPPSLVAAISFFLMLLIQGTVFAFFWLASANVAERMGITSKSFFEELKDELSDLVDKTKKIGGQGVKVPAENAQLAGNLARLCLFLARRIEYGMRWFALEVYSAQQANKALMLAVTLFLTATIYASHAVIPGAESPGAEATGAEATVPSATPSAERASFFDDVGTMMTKFDTNEPLSGSQSWIVFAGFGALAWLSAIRGILFIQLDMPGKLNPGLWVKFSEVAIDEKIAEIVEQDKQRAHQGGQDPRSEPVKSSFEGSGTSPDDAADDRPEE